MDKLKSSYIDMEAGTEHVRPPNPNTLYLCHGALEVNCRLYWPCHTSCYCFHQEWAEWMTTDLDSACQLLVPCYPVAKRYANKRQSTRVSSTNGYYGGVQEAPGCNRPPPKRRVALVNLPWNINTTSQQISAIFLKTRRMISWLTGRRTKGGRKPTNERNNDKKIKWDRKLKGEIVSLVKSEVNKQVDADKQENSKLSEVAPIVFGDE